MKIEPTWIIALCAFLTFVILAGVKISHESQFRGKVRDYIVKTDKFVATMKKAWKTRRKLVHMLLAKIRTVEKKVDDLDERVTKLEDDAGT